MMEEKNMHVSIDEGNSFFCHEMSANFNPMQFILDFKCITPRVDLRSKDAPTINVKHNVVMLDPYHAKQMLALLNKVVGDYEKEFGEIKKPESVEKFEKKIETQRKNTKPETITTPSYFG